MNIGVMLILLFGCVSSIYGDMAGGHSAGTATAQSLLGDAQTAAQHTAPSSVPGFVTDSPKEASLDNSSIAAATSAAVRSNAASTMIAENSRSRQKFVLDPNTDPMVINANRATANPEQTMEEMVVETADSIGEQDEIYECMEGEDEYRQSCRKHLVVNIRITQARTYISDYKTDTSDCRLTGDPWGGSFCVAHQNCCPQIPIYSPLFWLKPPSSDGEDFSPCYV